MEELARVTLCNGLVVVVKCENDDDPDLSHYGHFTDKPPDDGWFIDRAHGRLLGDPIDEPDYPDEPEFPEDTDEDDAENRTLILEYEAAIEKYDDDYAFWEECHGREVIGTPLEEHRDNREFRYFVPEDHRGHNLEDWGHVSLFDRHVVIAQFGSLKNADAAYAIQDYKRMLDYTRRHWWMMGLIVRVEYADMEVGKASCWGIESDGGPEYKQEIIADLVHEALSRVSEEMTRLVAKYDRDVVKLKTYDSSCLNLDKVAQEVTKKVIV